MNREAQYRIERDDTEWVPPKEDTGLLCHPRRRDWASLEQDLEVVLRRSSCRLRLACLLVPWVVPSNQMGPTFGKQDGRPRPIRDVGSRVSCGAAMEYRGPQWSRSSGL